MSKQNKTLWVSATYDVIIGIIACLSLRKVSHDDIPSILDFLCEFNIGNHFTTPEIKGLSHCISLMLKNDYNDIDSNERTWLSNFLIEHHQLIAYIPEANLDVLNLEGACNG